jgi:hypothetical protein
MGVKKWSEYEFQSVTEQLTRVYNEAEPIFRFTYTSTYMMYISMWENPHL